MEEEQILVVLDIKKEEPPHTQQVIEKLYDEYGDCIELTYTGNPKNVDVTGWKKVVFLGFENQGVCV